MSTVAINPALLIDTEEFTFVNVPSMYVGFTDVLYKGQRIAILNGMSAPLQWVAKNGSGIPIKIVDSLENLVRVLLEKSIA